MKRLILLILGLAPIFSAFAQGELSPAYSITADSDAGYLYLPDSCWQMMADATGKMSFQDAIRSNLFQATDKKINYHYNTYWLRYKIVNRMNKKVNIYASFNQDIEAVNLYVKSGTGSWKHYKSGILVPWKERNGLKSLVAIPLTIPSGNTITIYEKCSFNYTISSPRSAMVYFNFKKGIDKRQGEHYSQSLWSVFLLGILLLAVIINLYFFIIVREKEFLFFTLFLLSLALFRIAGVSQATGYIGDVFFKNYPAMQYYLTVFYGTFYDFLLIYFIRHALKTYHDFPRWDKYLIVLSLATIILSICAIFEPAILHKNLIALITFTFMGLGLIIDISLLITILFYVRSKDIIMRMMVYALVPYSIFSIVMDILAFPANISYLFSTPFRQAGKYMIVVWKLLDIGRTLGNICFIWMIVLFACVLFMRFARLRRRFARERLERERERRISTEQQKTELEKQVAERTSELKLSLEDLQSTQKQLIQSEKMASLGELTAGIAHEIQNPLNFVNNFSEVSVELIGEMKTDIDKGKMEEVKNISDDLTQNLQKINFHGKRADAIVKSMLEHSRVSTGKKELTNINALADEYLRLSYHGMRAKDKSFNATMKTDFDETIGKINIVPQDIGRVLLNLINNAFYACTERSRSATSQKPKAGSKKHDSVIPQTQGSDADQSQSTSPSTSLRVTEQTTDNGQPTAGNGYDPTVTVSTKKCDGKIEISVKDNGNGISQKIVNKIFQPFFTTKPTGEGTGLGLSLSYEIIKAQGGEIKVNTEEGEGTEFIVKI